MRPTPTIFFLSILLTIESLVGAVAIHNREVYKRAPGAEYKIDAYQDFNCAGHILGTIKGTGSMSMATSQSEQNTSKASMTCLSSASRVPVVLQTQPSKIQCNGNLNDLDLVTMLGPDRTMSEDNSFGGHTYGSHHISLATSTRLRALLALATSGIIIE
ncbi:hypothetical protein F5876DRAFT_69756 [Lentinula aff. lateritia]|uniref:Uncharacterized protein n=1 Tax=Lentinula aff. lateritia TaxID=2804960 RepID=A0ACC1TLJ1_9AGAR|nr:hypothetical protein F5876DRAFT_69756 [Lentinula aff. lateritia]